MSESVGEYEAERQQRVGGLSGISFPEDFKHVLIVGSGTAPDKFKHEMRESRWRPVKRVLDFALAAMGLVLLAPLFLLIAVLLRLECAGPVFVTQVRLGKDGRRFNCLKFRSIGADAEERLAAVLANDPMAKQEWKANQRLKDDPRVTGLGAFLRATSLDELPQLFNVLTGDMSIVGPRPIVAPEVPGYKNERAYFESADFADYARRKPGITGLW